MLSGSAARGRTDGCSAADKGAAAVYQIEQQGAGLMDAARLMQPLQERTAVQSKPATPRTRGEHTMQHVSAPTWCAGAAY